VTAQPANPGSTVESVVRDAVSGTGFELESLEEARAGQRRLIRVIIDSDAGVGLDDIATVSRAVSMALDQRDEQIAGPYTLEVTSPGVDRPLTEPRHWRRNRLRLVRAALVDGGELVGRIGDCDDEGVTLLASGALRRVRYARRARRAGTAGFGGTVNVDIAALRAIERDKDISFETVLEAIETALLTAYKHTDGHQPNVRIEVDRKTGLVRVLAQELDADGNVRQEWDDTPEGFGRIAATTARQVILRVLGQGGRDRRRGRATRRQSERPWCGGGPDRRDRGRDPAGGAGAEGDLPARRADQVLRGRRIPGTARTADYLVPYASQPGPPAVRPRGSRDR
jgi:ribosome maturation factor RimP